MSTPALVLGIALLAAGSCADAAVLCQAKGGRLAVRESCRKRQKAVDPAAFGVPGPAGPDGAAGAPGAPAAVPLRLLDANDVEVGRVLRFDPTSATVEIDLPSLASPIVMLVSPGGFPSQIDFLLYASDDCSGVAYMQGGFTGADVHAPRALVWGLAAYHAAGPPQDLTYASVESGSATSCSPPSFPTGRGTCCRTEAGDYPYVVPTARIPLSSLGLTPPFRAVLR